MAAKQSTEIEVLKVTDCRVDFCIVGTTPLILHRMSEKAMRELLMPGPKKNAASKASTMKHDPFAEFADAPYIDENPAGPTLLQHLASAFKGAIKGAALDLPGANKSQIGRLTWVNGERVSIYGIPQIFCAITRSSDINRTPDVRTRCIVPKWAARLSVSFVSPNLRQETVSNLLASAGITQGVGDWRPGKGAGTYGQFRLVGSDDAEFAHLTKHAGRSAQESAMGAPEAYDRETRELLEWFGVESKRRGFKAVA